MTVTPIREATDAEVEARMFVRVAGIVRRVPALVVVERDTLRREVCAEPSPPDPRYAFEARPHGTVDAAIRNGRDFVSASQSEGRS